MIEISDRSPMVPMTIESMKTLAQNMNFVSFDVLQMEQQSVKSHWFRHEQGLDIYYFQKDDGRLIKIHISFFGQVIEWNPLDGTRTGLMIEEEQGQEVIETVHFDTRANSESLAQSLVIIENAHCLNPDLREELLVLLQFPEATAYLKGQEKESLLFRWMKKAKSLFAA